MRRVATTRVEPMPGELAPYALPPAGDPAAWALAASVATEGLWYFDVPADEVRLAPRTLELLGYGARRSPPPHTEVGHHVDPRDVIPLQRLVDDILRGRRSGIELDLRILTVRGETRWTTFRAGALRGDDGRVRYIAGSITDIDDRQRVALQLREDSRRDALTGLPNRVALNERLATRIARVAGDPGFFAVLYADLDRFKYVNDTLGHATGDALLLETARRMGRALQARDMLARIGGDEFIILLDTVDDMAHAMAVAASIQQAMRAPVAVDRDELFAAVSIGIRTCRDPDCAPADLLRDADIAMYEAKREGGARSIAFRDEMYATMVERLRMQTALHRGG